MGTERVVFERIGEVDAVGTVQFAMPVPLVELTGIVFHLSLGVGLLDTAA